MGCSSFTRTAGFIINGPPPAQPGILPPLGPPGGSGAADAVGTGHQLQIAAVKRCLCTHSKLASSWAARRRLCTKKAQRRPNAYAWAPPHMDLRIFADPESFHIIDAYGGKIKPCAIEISTAVALKRGDCCRG